MPNIHTHRLSRLRRTPTVRDMLQEVRLDLNQIIAPLFISETAKTPQPIQSMPGHSQLPLSALTDELNALTRLGVRAVILFGIPSKKDATGSASLKKTGIIQKAIQQIKHTHPDVLVIADVCFCEYTSHGHCGVLTSDAQHIHQEKTLIALQKQAVSYAKAGADWVAPSGMTDGMVHAIRRALDENAQQHTAILSYAAKYHSAFYGPFREAAEGTPQFGDRKAYQMNPTNAKEALREAALDIEEGADCIMVKPAMQYLDVIQRIKTHYPEVPLCAYQVSGEYAMLLAAAKAGLVDQTDAMLESLIAIKRAGADLIITYFAKALAKALNPSKVTD